MAMFPLFFYEQSFVISRGFIGRNGGACDHTAVEGQDCFMVLCVCVKLHSRPVVLILCGA